MCPCCYVTSYTVDTSSVKSYFTIISILKIHVLVATLLEKYEIGLFQISPYLYTDNIEVS